MITKMLDIKTRDGVCDTYVAYPQHKSHLPIILFYMDAIGLRQRIYEMVEHLAKAGYYVIAPNLFYRSRRAPLVDYDFYLKPENIPEMLKQIIGLASQLNPELSLRDAEDFLTFARQQPEVNPLKVGAVGYCMGGGQVLRAAGTYSNDFQAAASFHAGGLATDLETSPHRWFPKITAEVYIGHADQDQSMPPEQMQKVDAALIEASVKFQAELYKDCRHGWTMSDLPASNKDGERKHWEKLLPLFERTLKD
jgi:carboxymethylenebutenolidase